MIRKADKKDAKEVIKLLNLAMGEIAYKLSGYKEPKNSEILEIFFTQKDNRLSYENVLVYEIDNKIVAAICFYKWHKNIDLPFVNHLKSLNLPFLIEKECNENELYIDSIAVSKDYRGQKIATKLINKAYEIAKNKGLNLSLVAKSDDEKVNIYYQKLGFKFTEIKILYGKKYNHLIKEI